MGQNSIYLSLFPPIGRSYNGLWEPTNRPSCPSGRPSGLCCRLSDPLTGPQPSLAGAESPLAGTQTPLAGPWIPPAGSWIHDAGSLDLICILSSNVGLFRESVMSNYRCFFSHSFFLLYEWICLLCLQLMFHHVFAEDVKQVYFTKKSLEDVTIYRVGIFSLNLKHTEN